MSPDYNIIGRRIKEARINKNRTQEDLAEMLNVSIAYVSRIERGSTQINLKRLMQIADFLGVSPSYFLTGSNAKSKEYLKEDFSNILNDCTPGQRKLIFQISELVSKTKIK